MTKIENHSIKIVSILNKAGYTAYFAGGYVRDKIMKRKVNDIDIATNAKPAEIKKVLDKNKIKHIEIGESFGVIAAVIPLTKNTNEIFEIATFRQDFGVSDSRHPQKVKFSSDPREDAVRRDFTINGLFATNQKISNIQYPISKQFSISNTQFSIIDFVGGLADIKSKTIRFIGDPNERIKEDALRMMRAVRFACQLDFQIEPKSFEAIKKNHDLIKKVSQERIRDELNKIMASNSPRWGMELLDETGLLEYIIPELIAGKDAPQPANYHFEGSVWNHTLLSLDKLTKVPTVLKNKGYDHVLALAVLLHDIGKPATIMLPKETGDRIRFNSHDVVGAKMAASILRRLKYSNEETDKVFWLIRNHMLFSSLFKMREAKRIRFLTHPWFPDLLKVFWVDANSSVRSFKGKPLPPELFAYNKGKTFLEKEKKKPRLPKPFLRGENIMKIMGITSGSKLVGEILRKIYDAQLEKKVKTKKEAMDLAKKLLKKK
ncbi:MAG: CCA tRNA nucleotidyltransferase [Patescibacteria group bacterium]|nr:CCA tRNA nucleotidyltransferase [Patescibacteria group bacterium]